MTARIRPIRTLIVNDDRMARTGIRALLDGDPDIELVGECGSGPIAVTEITTRSPDLVFLEVQMPRMTGFEVLKAIGDKRQFIVVFVTGHDSYAFEALGVRALYVAKPFDDRRFHRAVEQAKDRIRQARLDSTGDALETAIPDRASWTAADKPSLPDSNDHIAIRDGGRTVFVALRDIDWIEATDYYVQLHVGKKAYLLREPLRDLEARLDPRLFVRVHRSAIVALDRVAELRPSAHGDHYVRLRDGTDLRLSRSRRDHLRMLLAKRSRPQANA